MTDQVFSESSGAVLITAVADGKRLRFREWPVVGWRVEDIGEYATPITPGNPMMKGPLEWPNLISAVLVFRSGIIFSATDESTGGAEDGRRTYAKLSYWKEATEHKFKQRQKLALVA